MRTVRLQWRPIVVFALLNFTLITACIAVVWSVVLWIHLDDLKSNQVGDPEKEFLDTCMRDFEHLAQDSEIYLRERQNCMEELEGNDDLKWLPVIRLTVDERICDISALCGDGDPESCKDDGTPFDENFRPGTVRQCYDRITSAKSERNETRRAELLQEASDACISDSRWRDYEHKTEIVYCMWKEREQGVCTNSLRSSLNCPDDTSCCPTAQNRLTTPGARENKYQCAKSPLIGLYCQHVNYTTQDSQMVEQPCTSVSCSTFDWCRDFVDVSDLCLTEPCEEYRRAKNYAIACIVFACIAVLFDFGDIVILCCYHKAAGAKAAVDVASGCIKLMALMLCIVGGVRDFTNDLVNRGCYVEEGSNLGVSARDEMRNFMSSLAFSIVGSMCLSPLSAYWGGKLVDLPYMGRNAGVAQL